MYIDIVPNRKSPPAVLLRQSRRDGGKIVKTTLANLSQCPPEAVAALRLALRGVALVPHEEVFAVERSIPHGHVQAVLGVMRTVGMDALLAARPCRERALVLAMIAQRLLDPCSKLATTRVWHTTTLAQELGVADADANDLYAALDWLQQRQGRIEKKLAARHLTDGAVVLFDVSSSSYHGRTCPLARRGYNRDGDKLPSIVYGLLTDGAGRPIAVDVYPGNTGDPSTVPDQVEKLRMRFRLQRVVLVGDRGMLTHTQINALRGHPGVGWISALRFPAIRALAEHGAFQPSLFDTPHLAEITSDAYPGERLVVCYNPALAADRARTRDELLTATEARLARIAAAVARRTKTPMTADEIGVKVGKIINHYKVGKHVDLTIEDARLRVERNDASIAREAPLDGIYILRTRGRSERRRRRVPLCIEGTPLFFADLVHGLVQRLHEMEAVDDQRDIGAVVRDRPDIGGAHVATGPGNARFLPRAQTVVEEAIDGVATLARADPQDTRAVQVVDEGGELAALAVGDLVDPEGDQAADGVPVTHPRNDPVQQVGQGRGRQQQDLGRGLLGHDLAQGADAPLQAVGDPCRGRCPGDLLLHAPVSRTLNLLRGIPEHDVQAHEGQILPPARLGRLVHNPAASPTCRTAAAVFVRFNRQMQLGVAIFETKIGDFHALQT